MAELVLAHDIGTTGDKAVLLRADGSLAASARAAYPVMYPRPGWAEQDARSYWTAFCGATRQILSSPGVSASDIAAVSFSGQMQAALAVGRDGEPLRPSLIWADQRADAQATEMARRLPAGRVYAVTGHRPSASYSAAKIMWIRDNEPEVWRRVWKFLHAKDFVALGLTGEAGTDLSDASGMNLLDVSSMQWSAEMLDACGIHAGLLPELHESTDVIGAVTRSASAETGLLPGTPVVAGGGDGACATCGAGIVKAGDAYICLGTSAWMATASDHPVDDSLARVETYCHFRRGLYLPCGSMQAAGGALEWFGRNVAGSAPEQGVLEQEADGVEPGSEGVLFLPYLIGERSPWWDPHARGSFVGLSLRHGRGHMARAVMEGVAFNMRLIADCFGELGMDFPRYRMIGGGAQSPVWRQILADVLARPVAPLAHPQSATSTGAAIAGGVGVGLFSSIEEAARIVRETAVTLPDSARAEVYRKILPVFRSAYTQLAPVFKMLAGL